MKKRRRNFLEQIKRAREAAATPEAKPPVAEMSEAELDAEEKRLKTEIRRLRESTVEAGRQELADARSGRAPLFPRRRRRRYWK